MLVVKTTSPATSPPPAKLHPSKTIPSSRTSVALLLGPCSKPRPDSVVHHHSANYSTRDPPRQAPSEIGGVGGPAQENASLDRPLLREIDEREIRRSTGDDTSAPANPASRSTAHRFNEPNERDLTSQDQVRVEHRKRRLVAQETGRGLLEGQLFLLGGVRRVVGRYEVEDAVTQCHRDAVAVFLRPQGRVYPVHPVERADEPVGEREVVRGGIRRNVRPLFEECYECRRERGRYVGYVHLRPRLGCQHQGRRRRRVL